MTELDSAQYLEPRRNRERDVAGEERRALRMAVGPRGFGEGGRNAGDDGAPCRKYGSANRRIERDVDGDRLRRHGTSAGQRHEHGTQQERETISHADKVPREAGCRSLGAGAMLCGTVAFPMPAPSLLTSSFQRFFRTAAAGGVLLVGCAAVALVLANSPWADSYHHVWQTPITLSAGGHALTLTAHQLINDGLMAIFFLLVGLEIKREVLVGELASLRQAA